MSVTSTFRFYLALLLNQFVCSYFWNEIDAYKDELNKLHIILMFFTCFLLLSSPCPTAISLRHRTFTNNPAVAPYSFFLHNTRSGSMGQPSGVYTGMFRVCSWAGKYLAVSLSLLQERWRYVAYFWLIISHKKSVMISKCRVTLFLPLKEHLHTIQPLIIHERSWTRHAFFFFGIST